MTFLDFEKGEVHPLANLIKREYKLNWREFGEFLYRHEKNAGNSLINPISASVARRLSTQAIKSYWFLPAIGGISLDIWNERRSNAASKDEIRQIDLEFSKWFAYELRDVYHFWYEAQKESSKPEPNTELINAGYVLCNSIVNKLSELYELELPNIPD